MGGGQLNICQITAAGGMNVNRSLSVIHLRRHAVIRPQAGFSTIGSLNFVGEKHAYCAPLKKKLAFPCKIGASLVDGGTVLQDAGAAALIMSGAYALVSIFDNLTERQLIQQSLSRKLVHILSGLLFMASWPIFSTSSGARYFASVVPLLNCIRLLVYGLSLASDEGLVQSVTREGKTDPCVLSFDEKTTSDKTHVATRDLKELLRGPLYYVLILILCALLFWRESPVGVVSVSMMCGGDGIADIMGRRYGSLKLPYNHQKSWVGSISMFTFGFLVSIGMLYYFSILGYFQLEWSETIQKVALVSLIATLVESLPTTGTLDDNISVPLACMITAFFSFGY